MNLGELVVAAPAVCVGVDDKVEGETALAAEVWLAECVAARWLFWLVGGAILELLRGHQLAVSLDTGVWVGERDCEAELP